MFLSEDSTLKPKMSVVWTEKSLWNSAYWENQVLPSATFKKISWPEHTVFQHKEYLII